MTGIVAHTYPEWWLKLTGQVAHWSTDYSLVQYLEAGQDCEVYGSFEEMYEKAAFYTKHEELRKQIARNGFMKAQEIFTFRNRIEQMI